MKYSDKDIDARFKELEEDQFQVPTSFLEDLNTRMDAREKSAKRKGFFRFWIMIPLLILIAVSTFALVKYTSDKQQTNNFLSSTDEQHNPLQPSSDPVQAQSTTKTRGTPSESGNPFKPKQPTTTTTKSDTSTPEHSGTQSSSNSKKTQHNSTSSAAHQPSGRPLKTATTSSSTPSNNSQNGQSASSASVPSSHPLNVQSTSSGQALSNSSTSGNTGSTVDSSTDLNETDASTSMEPAVLLQLAMRDYDFPVTEAERTASIAQVPSSPASSVNPANKKDNQTKKTGNWEQDVQVYFSPSASNWKAQSDSFTKLQSYASPSFSYDIGAKWNLFYKDIQFSAGASYSRSTEKISFEKSYTIQTGTDSVFLYFVYDSITMDSTAIYQYNPVYGTITDSKQLLNRYSWISVPLSVGYRFRFQSWDVIPSIGARLNFGIASNTGNYPDNSGLDHPIEAVRFNTDFSIQTEIRKNFNNYHVFVTPYYRGNLSPVIKDPNLRITHRYWGISFGAGISF